MADVVIRNYVYRDKGEARTFLHCLDLVCLRIRNLNVELLGFACS